VVLCVPRDARGLDELQEGPALEAFRLDPQQVKELRSIVLGAVVPGIVGMDFREFCGGVEEVQRTVGEAFSHVQGGRFSAHSVKAVDALASAGASGIGQSSWGPTVYGFFASIEEALRASTRVQEELGERWSVVVTRGRNRGAEVEVS
jgi:beta-ribofuranosylaminobenzene 5'-phosphate synthase